MDIAIRTRIRIRAEGRCEYCRLPDSVQLLPFHVEHIVARQHGGSDDEANLAWSCDRCNAYKGPNLATIDPESGLVIRLFHPRNDRWRDHFAFRDEQIVGVSSIGRATVQLLQFNSVRRVELRCELIASGCSRDANMRFTPPARRA